MSLNYAISLAPLEEGGFLIECRDLPGVLSDCDTREEAVRQGQGAIIAMISAMIDDNDPIPDASPAEAEEIVIPLSGQIQQKIQIYRAIQAKNWRMADLARAMNVTHQMVRRLLDPCHNSTAAQLDQATWALGMVLETNFRPSAEAALLVAE